MYYKYGHKNVISISNCMENKTKCFFLIRSSKNYLPLESFYSDSKFFDTPEDPIQPSVIF